MVLLINLVFLGCFDTSTLTLIYKLRKLNENEQVHIFNLTNGERFITYVIEGERNSGVICTNGAAAHCARKGDCLIIVSFANMPLDEAKKYKPKLVYVNNENLQVEADLLDGKLVKILG